MDLTIMKKLLFSSVKVLILTTVITGFIYPLFITAVGFIFFKDNAEGSIIYHNGSPAGSALIGQSFSGAKYFHARPSAIGNNPLPSGGSNLGPVSNALLDSVNFRRKIFLADNPGEKVAPVEMLFASGSGVDPDISPEAAYAQIERIAVVRKYNQKTKSRLTELVSNSVEKRQLGFLGMERVNVLLLNIGLDNLNERE
jgi:K+-transporting ATPase ATPase C chain